MARFAGMQLEQLRITTNAFLELANALGRPLLVSERRSFHWLLLEWEAPSIHSAFNQMPKSDSRLPYYTQLIARLREIIVPDPIKQIHLHRARGEHVAEQHDGNYATRSELFEGVSIRRLSTKDVVERLQLLNRLSGNIGAVVQELALVRKRDHGEAKQIAGASKRLADLSRAFIQKVEHAPQPARVPSLEESLEHMRVMNGLMEAVAG